MAKYFKLNFTSDFVQNEHISIEKIIVISLDFNKLCDSLCNKIPN